MSAAAEVGRDRGQATVEFALVAPLLVVLVLGLVQGVVFGIDAIRVAGAARESARAVAVGGTDQAIRSAAVRGGGGLDPARLGVAARPSSPRAGEVVTVEVSYQTRFLVPGLGVFGLHPPVLRSAVAMRAE